MISHSLRRRPNGYDFPSELLCSLPASGKPASLRVLADDFGLTTQQVQRAIKRLKERFDLSVTQTAVSIAPASLRDSQTACEGYWAKVYETK